MTYRDGQEVTVIDAKGVKGRGVMTSASGSLFRCRVHFDHSTENGGPWPAESQWHFLDDQSKWLGLTIEPHPFTEEGNQPSWEGLESAEKNTSIWMEIAEERGAEIARLREVVREAAAQFRLYERLHAAKGNLDGDAKARTNAEFAERLEAALSPDPVEGEGK